MLSLGLLYALSLLARGFPVTLLFGALCFLAGRQSKSPSFTVVGWMLVGGGALGGVYGVPYYYAEYRHASDARSHFKALCETKAMVSLPARPVFAKGVVWSETGQSRASHLASRDHYSDFVGPSRGRYIEVEQPASTGGIAAAVWDDMRGLDLLNSARSESRREPTLPFEVRTQVITTPEDQRYGIEGIETLILDRSNGQPIARRVVFGRVDRSTPVAQLRETCPARAIEPGDCDLNGCTILPFVFAAVRPQAPADLPKAFHLYAGAGRRTLHCGSEIAIGRGIREGEIQWQMDKPVQADATFEVSATGEVLVCDSYGFSSSHTFRFSDSGKVYAMEAEQHNLAHAEGSRRPLLSSVQQVPSRR